MDKSKKVSFPIISDELFATFFSQERSVTKMIINTLFDTEFEIDRIEPHKVSESVFGIYHPYVLADAHTNYGRCEIILTPISQEIADIKSQLIYWMINKTVLSRRNIYPILIAFDTTESEREQKERVSLRILDDERLSTALGVVRMREKSNASNILDEIINDLLCCRECDIKNDDIRRIYALSYEKSGLEERRNVAYSLWLESVNRDIRSLGIDPGSIAVMQQRNRSSDSERESR